MPKESEEHRPKYQATIGRLNPGAKQCSDPDAGRVRVHIGGPLAKETFAAELATELAALITEDLARAEQSQQSPPTHEVEISLRGLSLADELEGEISAHVRERLHQRVGSVSFRSGTSDRLPSDAEQ